ncbi:hypothetical protein [Methanocella sp. MCL-LM]|uniref:hypothetical protein n=1 Tax=Methanocella sp. MCL-LM TaxID=3412035 RepID=UPI003C746B1F
MQKWKLAIIILAVGIAIPLACISLDQLSLSGEDSIVFIEHKNNTRGQLVYGNYTGKTISGEEYVYDAENSVLTCVDNSRINSSLKLLVGTTQSLMQDAGYGISTRLLGVSACPANTDGINIDDVLDDGTVLLRYNGSSIRLSPGQRWVRVYSENVETDGYRVKLTNTEIIRNNGKIRLASNYT